MEFEFFYFYFLNLFYSIFSFENMDFLCVALLEFDGQF